jgi:hypothetical protein
METVAWQGEACEGSIRRRFTLRKMSSCSRRIQGIRSKLQLVADLAVPKEANTI